MLDRRSLLCVVTCAAVALPMHAQGAASPQCALAPTALRDACQKGTDIFTMLMPQVQGALAGGGAVLGSSSAMRGLSIGLRVNALDGDLPDLGGVRLATTGIVRSNIGTTRTPVPMPTLDLAAPIFPGFLVGRQRIFSADVLVNVAYLPSRQIEDFRVRTTNGSLKLGYGARIGLVADRMLMPAVSVSYFRRTLPTATFNATINTDSPLVVGASSDSVTLAELSIRNDAIRIAASKRLGFIELGGGVGEDRYRTFSQLQLRVNTLATQSVSGAYVLTQQISRRAAYASAALNIARFRIAGEAGTLFGGDSLSTYNTFAAGRVTARRLFGSVGVRLRF